MPITKTARSLAAKGAKKLWLKGWFRDSAAATAKAGPSAAWRTTKAIGRGARFGGKKFIQGNIEFGKYLRNHENKRNAILPALAVAGAGAYMLPRRVKANMVHVNPDSKNYTTPTLKGVDFTNPYMWPSVKNTDMLF